MSESMTGKMIMVNPDLPDDMIWRKGDIAIITKDELDSVTIRFDNDQFAKYGKEAVLAFKSPKEIYDHLEDEAMTMPKSNFRKLRTLPCYWNMVPKNRNGQPWKLSSETQH